MAVLSKAETVQIVTTWELVKPDMDKHGLEFFLKLFREHPDVQTKYFSHMSIEAVDVLTKHGFSVMQTVDDMVAAVKTGDDNKLVEKIHWVTRNHYKRGVKTTDSFEIVISVLLNYLSGALGDNLTPEGGKAWTKLLDTMIAVVGEEQKRLK